MKELNSLRQTVEGIRAITQPITSLTKVLWGGLVFAVTVTSWVVMQWASVTARIDNLDTYGGTHTRSYESQRMQTDQQLSLAITELRTTLQGLDKRLDRLEAGSR